MKMDPLRMAAFVAYLLSWVVLAIAALAGALPRLRKGAGAESAVSLYGLLGTVAQACALFAIVLPVGDAPLRPGREELMGVLLLAPMAAGLFVWAQRSAPAAGDVLVTSGAYAQLRHPIYLAFFLLLIATGLLVSSRVWMILPVLLYIAGTEMRIAGEEAELARRFADVFADYQRRTRWRWLPGLR